MNILAPRNGFATIFASLVLLATFSACGGGTQTTSATTPSTTASASAAPTAAPKQRLTVALGAFAPSFAYFFWGIQKGKFADAGVDVTFVNVGSNVANAVVSGQADLGLIGITAAMPLPHQGKALTVVGGTLGSLSTLRVVAIPSVTNVSQCKKFVAQQGSGSYAYTLYGLKALKLQAELVPVGTTSAAAALVASGQVDCSFYSSIAQDYAGLNDSGKIHIIYDPSTDPKLPPEFTTFSQTVSVGIFGTTDHVKAMGPGAIAGFLKGLSNSELAQEPDSTIADVANVVVTNYGSEYAGQTVDSLTKQIQSFHANGPTSSRWQRLTADGWNATVELARLSGLDYADPSVDPNYSYAKMVDMSYWDNATK